MSTTTTPAAAGAGWKRAGRGAATVALAAICLVMAAVTLVPTALGLQRYVITGGSMQGTIDRGSVAFDRVVPVRSLRTGDVITFSPPSGHNAAARVTHRIIAVAHDRRGRPVFRTKGDANLAPDPWRFTLSTPNLPRVVGHVPYAGFLLAALQIRRVRMLVIGLPALIIALSILAGLFRESRAGRPAPRPRSSRLPRGTGTTLVLGVLLGGVAAHLSGADFAAASANAGSRLQAATDWVAPTVAVTDPGSPLRGHLDLRATATDTGGVASVTLQRSPAGTGTWTDVCTTTTAPYTCPVDSTTLPDGSYDVRAIAVDTAGNAATSATVTSRLVDNTAGASPGAVPAHFPFPCCRDGRRTLAPEP